MPDTLATPASTSSVLDLAIVGDARMDPEQAIRTVGKTGTCHGRAMVFPHFFRTVVRGQGQLSLPDAIRHCATLPAQSWVCSTRRPWEYTTSSSTEYRW